MPIRKVRGMKAKCENSAVFLEFYTALVGQRRKEEEMCAACIEERGECPNVGHCYDEGTLLVRDYSNKLAIARSAYARGKLFPVAGYRTCSGKGEYWLEGRVLFFEGYRNSFKSGCDVIHPTPEQGWELVESSQPGRGLWD